MCRCCWRDGVTARTEDHKGAIDVGGGKTTMGVWNIGIRCGRNDKNQYPKLYPKAIVTAILFKSAQTPLLPPHYAFFTNEL
jgi:hypothetical protein